MKPKNILYVEDDENDLWLLERAFWSEGMKESLHVVRDGAEAIAWLAGDGDYGDRAKYPLPNLVLLDIRLPKVDGFAVLRWARARPPFNTLPMIMFSISYELNDVTESYRLGANLFLVKPAAHEELRHIARFLVTWLQHSQPLPVDERLWRAVTLRDVEAASRPRGGPQSGASPPPA